MADLFSAEAINKLKDTITNKSLPMAARFRALFTLRNIPNTMAIDALSAALDDPSVLLKHEVCFVLGQMRDPYSIPILTKVLEDLNEDPIVRHEAGEALGAIGEPSLLPLLEKYCNDPHIEVSETCIIAADRVRYLIEHPDEKDDMSPFETTDPAPALKEKHTVSELKDILCNPELPLFKRYRAMFSLRNMNTKESVLALCEGFKDSSALMRHEIAYVMGQLQNEHSLDALTAELVKNDEHPMVRHEAAEALSAIGGDNTPDLLQKYSVDESLSDIVRDSCIVATDMYEYHHDDSAFQYTESL